MAMTKEELKEFIEEMKKYKARHTELITVYVPKGFNLSIITKQLENEKSTASNIKSSTTRKNVEDALESLIRLTKSIQQTPPNGLVLFAGNVSEKEGKEDFITKAIEPPEELNIRLYRCDQVFILDPLEEMIEEKEIYGLVAIERKEATIGLLIGKKIKILKKLESMVPGKTHKGGQSSARYARIREVMAKEFYRKVAEIMKKEFLGLGDKLKGILVGGPGPTKEEFLKEGNLVTALKEKIKAVKDIGYGDEHGIELLVEASSDVLAEQEIILEKKILENFFNMLGKERENTALGEEEVNKALDYGAPKILLLSTELPKQKLKYYEKKAEEISAEVKIISTDTEEGVQFKNLSGVGAILRFKIPK